MRETDLADELFGQPGKTALPAGVRVATARQGGVTITRVEIAREGLARPRGRYVTLAAVPAGWVFWALAEQPAPLPPEQLLEKQKPPYRVPDTEVLFVSRSLDLS